MGCPELPVEYYFRKTAYGDFSEPPENRLYGDFCTGILPLDYAYDSYGRMTQLSTYRNTNLENPDVTTWAYQDATGLLTSNTYADNKSVNYTYSNEGKLATRTWSRGVVTTYSYNPAGDLTGISYSDSTPAVAFTYNRLGQQLTVTDAVGSRTFGYNGVFQLTSEAITGIYDKTLSRSYDTLGRSSGINIGTEYAVGYSYDALGRFSTVTNGNDTFTYSYLANSNLIQSITYPNTISVTKSYEANRDLVTSVLNKYGQTVVSEYDYTNDDIGRRTAMGKSGTAFSQSDSIAYGYNDKSEVTSAVAQNQTTYNYGFSFDSIGNRVTSSSNETGTSVTRSYTSNQLNQYTAIDNPIAAPTYDDDGNMTGNGNVWSYTWDGENRLIVAENLSSLGGTGQRLEFKYDYMSRRVEKRVLDGGSEMRKERFVYNKYLQIEKLDALDSNAIENKRVWSVGDKIIADINSSGSSFYTLGDENKNITDYLDAIGTVQGHFEYSPFGKVIVANGSNPDSFDFKFSSEYFDQETGQVYYNYRYYSPEMGRWLSREPLGEKAFQNILILERWSVKIPLMYETIIEDYITPAGINWNLSNLPMLQESDIFELLSKIFNQQNLNFNFNNPINMFDFNGREPASATVGTIVVVGGESTGTIGTGAVATTTVTGAGAIVVTAVVGYEIGNVIADAGFADWFARMSTRWSCEAQCNVQAIGCTCCPERVFGFGVGPTQSLACQMAKGVATQSCPRGCYPRHCYCPRCWRN